MQRDEAMTHGLIDGAFDNVATAIRACVGLAHQPPRDALAASVSTLVCDQLSWCRYVPWAEEPGPQPNRNGFNAPCVGVRASNLALCVEREF